MAQFKDRICKDCKEVKPCRSSGVTRSGIVQYRTRCVVCYQRWETQYKYGVRREKTLFAKRIRMSIAKKRCVDYKGGKCELCGYDKSLRALTFHHKNRTDKRYEITTIKDHNWEKVQQELDKCILVCFNCHMEQEEIHDAH